MLGACRRELDRRLCDRRGGRSHAGAEQGARDDADLGVPKGSFYHHLGSKADLGLALVDAYADYFARKLDLWFLDERLSPLDRLRGVVSDAEAGMARFEYRRGCLVGNLGQEISALPASFRERLAAVFADWEARTARCLEAAKAAGQIAPEADCKEMATFIWIGCEGAVLRAKLDHSSLPVDRFATGFFKLIERRS